MQAIQHHKPHTKLEINKGVLHQKLIFVDAPSDLRVSPTDCVIYNTGERSAGCALDEYKPFVSNVKKPFVSNKYKPFVSNM